DAALDNLPEYAPVITTLTALGKPHDNPESVVRLNMLLAEISKISFNVEYEVVSSDDSEDDDDEDEDVALFEMESGFEALNAAAQGLATTFLYLLPVKAELPTDLQSVMDDIWPLYETKSVDFFNGHWWLSGRFVDG